ncbi:MAG TPA: nickel-dependent lactate racemase [Chthonomonadales bacterium]|nr:nickel-dependent lactate racemase [Chthonomonadales bacterium]
MDVCLSYGERGLIADIPDARLAAVLSPPDAPQLPDLGAAVRSSLQRPIGSRPLAHLAAASRHACIVVCDATRPVPTSAVLPHVLAALDAGGIPLSRVTVLIATGTHRPADRTEILRIVGEDLAPHLHVVNHACDDPATHAAVGHTERGTRVLLDTRYRDADLRITVGLIEPHFMAGYSGGRKLVMPGVAALETVLAWHSPAFLEHPRAASGFVDGNPVHEEATAAVHLCPPHFTIDVTLSARNMVTGVFAGGFDEAWRAGVDFADRHCRARVAQPADVVVTTCAGYPLDATFYQAVKGMVGALPVVAPGGDLIIAAECREGIGSDAFRDLLLAWDDLGRFVEAIQAPGWTPVRDQWEVEELAKAVCHCRVTCFAEGIPPAILGRLHVTPADSVEAAVAAALERHGPSARVLAIPRGPYVIAEAGAPAATG